MPPYGYLLELHVVVVLRTIILFHYGSVNTRASASFMDTAGLYVILCLIFFSFCFTLHHGEPLSKAG